MKTFQLTISSAEKVIYNGKSPYCNINLVSGNLGIEPSHEAFLGVLQGNSNVRFRDESGDEKSFAVESGVIIFQNNSCILTVSILI